MFSAGTLSKSKPLISPSHKETNSRKRLSEISFNRSFDTAQSLLYSKSSCKFKQTKLCFQKHQPPEQSNEKIWVCAPSTSKNITTQFFLLPNPRDKAETSIKNQMDSKKILLKPLNINDQHQKASVNIEMTLSNELMEKNGRNQLVILGEVDFCLRINKIYPNTKALWDIYGKLIRITSGHNRNEQILLLRRTYGGGPILQSIYYDFNKILDEFKPDCCLRVTGRFINENSLQTYKLEQIDCENVEERFSRIQNVISFALLQNKT